MMASITAKNYRCFPDTSPLRFDLSEGFTSLVGVNNAGKSTVLRFLYEFKELYGHLGSGNQILNLLRENTAAGFNALSVPEQLDVFSNSNERDMEIVIECEEPLGLPQSQVPRPTAVYLTIARSTPNQAKVEIGWNDSRWPYPGGELDLSIVQPMLHAMGSTFYIGPFRNALNLGTFGSYFDIQIGQAFVERWRQMKSGTRKYDNEAAYSLTEGIKGIFGFRDLEINPSPDAQTLQLFVDGKSYRLGELGSGLTQFVIVLANVAAYRPTFILIDEPELNLHPSLQLDFLTTLTSYATKGVLFATHSLGLARASSDRLYSFVGMTEFQSLNPTKRIRGWPSCWAS